MQCAKLGDDQIIILWLISFQLVIGNRQKNVITDIFAVFFSNSKTNCYFSPFMEAIHDFCMFGECAVCYFSGHI